MKTLLGHWTLYEKLWLLICTAIAALTVSSDSTPFGFTVFLSGVLCVVFAAKGNILNYVVGSYNTFGYAWLAYQNGLFGEVWLNLLFFAPMNIIGFFMWRRHTSGDTVEMRKMPLKSACCIFLACIVGILALGLLLSGIPGQNSPYIDAATNMLSITATILMVRRYREQWAAYIILNAFTILMWTLRTIGGSAEGGMMVVMWGAYLINAVYGLRVWTKGAKKMEVSR